ncbi:MAG: hypothetical protein R3F02_06895 [Thiolinea sp.]
MSKPISNTTATPLTFEQRLPLVRAEVTARVMSYPANQRNAVRARLWVSWIKRNVLEVA